jgi:hypothetical protein
MVEELVGKFLSPYAYSIPFNLIYCIYEFDCSQQCSGVKIFDIEKLSRIAHIDRPSGGKYGSISMIHACIK